MKCLLSVLIATYISGLSSQVLSAGCPELKGIWPIGDASEVEVAGNLAITAGDRGLWVVDISNPESPRFVSGLFLDSSVNDLELHAGYAYLGLWSGIRVVDLSDPVTPTEVGRLDTSGGVEALTISGGLLYLVEHRSPYDGAFGIVDVSDATSPVGLAYRELDEEPGGVALAGNHAFVLTESGFEPGIHTFDVSNPSSPVEIGFRECSTFFDVEEIEVSGNHAFVALGNRGLEVFDISSPSAPVRVGRFNGSTYGVEIDGVLAYLAWGGGLAVVGVWHPSEPVLLGLADTDFRADDVAMSGGAVLIVGGDGIATIDAYDPLDPIPLAVRPAVRYRSIAAASKGFVYALTYWEVRVVDARDPSHPIEVSRITTPDRADGVAAENDEAYVLAGGAIHVFDVSDPSLPVEIASLDLPYDSQGPLSANGGLVFVAGSGTAGVFVVDVSDPAGPFLVGEIPGFLPSSMAFSGDLVYAARDAYSDTLQIADVSDPAHPYIVSEITTVIHPDAISEESGFVYLGGSSSEYVAVVDARDPALPVEVAALERCGDLVTTTGRAFLGLVYGGLMTVSLSVPGDPLVLGEPETPFPFTSMEIEGTMVFGMQSWRGLATYDISCAVPLFEDRFESGDASAWSRVVP